jgi:hypothetical protein
MNKALRTLFLFMGVAIAGAICWAMVKRAEGPETVAMSSALALTDRELQQLTREAKNGSCQAATRLGIFYFSQMADLVEAEKWLRIADPCSTDPRMKEFLLACIMLEKPTARNIDDVKRIMRELDQLDPPRSIRLRPEAEKYVGNEPVQLGNPGTVDP